MEEKIKNMDLDAQKSSSSLFPSCSSRISATTLTTSSSGLLPQVIEFQNYLAKHGGHYGGWDDLSHAAFVRIREKLGVK